MKGIERIQKVFSTSKEIKLMTHVVGGYPTIPQSEGIVHVMAKQDVDLVEIQLPFSDPIADGPVIVQANHVALKAGVTTEMVFSMIERLRKDVSIPLLIMSYLNPIYAFGVEAFIDRVTAIGVDGVIIPDCPPEEIEMNLPELCNIAGLAFVPLIAPTTKKDRMHYVAQRSLSPFVYAVLRLGVTGKKTSLDTATIDYLKQIKESTQRCVAAGFGIQERAQIDALIGHADCGIVGSALLKRVNNALEGDMDPVEAVDSFLKTLKG